MAATLASSSGSRGSGRFCALGRTEEGETLLAGLTAEAESAGRQGDVIELLVLRALIEETAGRRERAAATFARAVTMAGTEGHMRVFLDEGEPARRLAEIVARRGTGGLHAHRLCAASSPSGQPASVADADGTEHLSPRERDVLAALAAGSSNQDIAEAFAMSVGTAKWHVHNILGKLGARSRTEAVARARALQLLS